jgi:hypothetical protein
MVLKLGVPRKVGEFLDQLSYFQLLKKNSASWS